MMPSCVTLFEIGDCVCSVGLPVFESLPQTPYINEDAGCGFVRVELDIVVSRG